MADAIVTLLGMIVGWILISLLFAFPVMILWNYCFVGAITGVNEVTWLQTWGLMILFNVLFKAKISKKV